MPPKPQIKKGVTIVFAAVNAVNKSRKTFLDLPSGRRIKVHRFLPDLTGLQSTRELAMKTKEDSAFDGQGSIPMLTEIVSSDLTNARQKALVHPIQNDMVSSTFLPRHRHTEYP